LIAPEDVETMHQSANRAIETLSSWRMEYRICTASGRVKWLEVSASPEVMNDGSIGWDGVILDISDRHRADDVVNLYRSKLEETVKQRTAELEAANHELSLLVKIDGLTQIANRRHFDQHLSDDWKRLARSKQPLSLIMCDVDYFKRFNDSYGHPEGDKVLKKIADILKQVAKRPDDLPARYGGEEFAIVLPNTDLVGAMQVAEAIRQEVLALRINHKGSSVNGFVSLSLGIATVTPNEIAESVRSPEDLIKIADRALYQAKHNGRNQSHVQDYRCLLKEQVF
jgi:diguanylate cyclase (GGDEF)-like protein